MSVTMFSTQVRTGPAAEIFLSGDLDLASAPALQSLADSLDPTCRQLVLDLAGVTFIDSTGISALVGLHNSLGPDFRMLVIQGAQGQVREVLAMSGVDQILHVVP